MQPAEKRITVSESILAAMRQTNALFDSEVIAGKNIGALDRIYTRDAHVLPPGAPMIEGREQIKNFWKQAIEAMGLTNVKLTIVHAESTGDGVVEIGRADLALAGGQIVTVKYVVHWNQEDGVWKWNVDIWNPNQQPELCSTLRPWVLLEGSLYCRFNWTFATRGRYTSAALTRCGVNGATRSFAPVASKTALASAA